MSKKEVNLLELVPFRNREWEKDEQAQVVILAPRFTNKWLLKMLVPRMKSPSYRVNMDAVGSWVWLNCDGEKTVEEIGKGLVKKFGENVEPVYDRLGQLFRIMEEHLFIRFKNLT